MKRASWQLMLPLVGFVAACGGGSRPGGSQAVPIDAAAGGVVEVAGAKLTIPPGALSEDASITLEVKDTPTEPPENPMRPAGPSVRVDLGGASLGQAASLELPTEVQGEDGSLVILETLPESTPDDEPRLRVHAARPVTSSGGSVSAQALPTRVAYAVMHAGTYAAYRVPKPKPQEGGVRSLQVPFYYQAGIPWCSPTSLAMVLNYHQPQAALLANPKFPGGLVSNYGLASLIRQPIDSGASGVSILRAAGIPEDSYAFMRWDAELIPGDSTSGGSDAFTAYVASATTGFFGLFPPKPVWTASDRLWHAFVITGITGSSIDGVYVSDSNARPDSDWNGAHAAQSWRAFRDANCTLKDAADPSKGCKGEGDADTPDLETLVFYSAPRPEAERRGSIELAPGNSLLFRNPSNYLISEWMWDGRYPNGYFFSDEATLNNEFPYGSNLVQDTEFRSLIYRSSLMQSGFDVVNVTDVALDFELEAQVYIGGSMRSRKVSTVNVGAYNSGWVYLNFGNLAELTGTIGAPTPARLELSLRQNGVLQDAKTIAFKLASDPTQLPSVRILVPGSNTTLLKGEAFTFIGEGFDAHTLPDGRVRRLSWFEGATHLGNGRDYTLTPSSAGSRTVTLVARGEYGTQATTAVTVNVIDPTRTPGEIVIVEPRNDATYWSPDVNVVPVDVPLVGYATYSNGAPVPGERLVWTARSEVSGTVTEVGRGSSLSVKLNGGRNTGIRYTIGLTALGDDGQAIGSRTVSILVGYTYVG
ncbi:MAG: C39 family peptidase [Myxococcaceae bacterium]|nr:C39 family peptidase [Myxococcaceae bacterium]